MRRSSSSSRWNLGSSRENIYVKFVKWASPRVILFCFYLGGNKSESKTIKCKINLKQTKNNYNSNNIVKANEMKSNSMASNFFDKQYLYMYMCMRRRGWCINFNCLNKIRSAHTEEMITPRKKHIYIHTYYYSTCLFKHLWICNFTWKFCCAFY